MDTYERSVRVEAPLDEVWAFHDRIEGLEALTPEWLRLAVESVRGPDGERDPAGLVPGTDIRLSVRPCGVGPRIEWTSRILDRQRSAGSAYFRDEMRDGPFRQWVHDHCFFADGDGTVLRDRVRYELPVGGLGRTLGPLGWFGFEPMFRERHRRTRQLLE